MAELEHGHEPEHNHANAQGFVDEPQATDMQPLPPPEPLEQGQEPDLSHPQILAFIEQKIREGVQEGITQALKGQPLKANTINPTQAQLAQFKKMGYKERNELQRSNPTQYNLLKGMI